MKKRTFQEELEHYRFMADFFGVLAIVLALISLLLVALDLCLK